jgi:hypothetical protein
VLRLVIAGLHFSVGCGTAGVSGRGSTVKTDRHRPRARLPGPSPGHRGPAVPIPPPHRQSTRYQPESSLQDRGKVIRQRSPAKAISAASPNSLTWPRIGCGLDPRVLGKQEWQPTGRASTPSWVLMSARSRGGASPSIDVSQAQQAPTTAMIYPLLKLSLQPRSVLSPWILDAGTEAGATSAGDGTYVLPVLHLR